MFYTIFITTGSLLNSARSFAKQSYTAMIYFMLIASLISNTGREGLIETFSLQEYRGHSKMKSQTGIGGIRFDMEAFAHRH